MRSVGDVIWCGASAPVVQGLFVGLGVSAVTLVVFPFAFIATRPAVGIQSGYRRSTTYLRWSRWAAWVLGPAAIIALVGYVMLYTDASGNFCPERFDGHMQLVIYIWTAASSLTFALLVLVAVLRGLTYRLNNKDRGG